MKQIAFVFVLLLSGCTTTPYAQKTTTSERDLGHTKIYVVGHGWHTGLVIPAKDIAQDLPDLRKRFGNTRYLEFGWGDKGFYQAETVTIGLTLKSLFTPNSSLMHVVAVPLTPREYFPKSKVSELCLTNQGYRSLKQFIARSFQRGPSGQLVPLRKGIYGNSQFYDAVDSYHAMNTCNKWTAKALKNAGMNISTTFKLTSGSVMRFVKTHNSSETRDPARLCP